MTDIRHSSVTLADSAALEQARHLMIEQQIRTWEVLDPRVLDSLSQVRRERYVPAALRALAFADTDLPLTVPGAAPGETMFPPKLEARVVQAVQPAATDKALEIGAGSGYLAALLAHHVAHVTTVEIDSGLAAFAAANLQRERVVNVAVAHGNGANRWGSQSYDIIIASGGLPQAPEGLLAQLAPGGRAVFFVGDEPVLQARLYQRHQDAVSYEVMFETWVQPLPGLASQPAFVF